MPILYWVVTCCAAHGATAETRACAAALAQIATVTGQAEALAALAHALGETALLDSDPVSAAAHLCVWQPALICPPTRPAKYPEARDSAFTFIPLTTAHAPH